jgi:hypothetical protein
VSAKLVQVAPVVTLQPASVTVTKGTAVTFTSTAFGVPLPTEQWQVSIDGGNNWMNVFGAMSQSLHSGPLLIYPLGLEVRAVFINSLGAAISDAATATVTP